MKRFLALSLAGLLALAATASAHGYGAFRAAVFARPAYYVTPAATVIYTPAPAFYVAPPQPAQYGRILDALRSAQSSCQQPAPPAPPTPQRPDPFAPQAQAGPPQQPQVYGYAAPGGVITQSYSYGTASAFAAPAYGYGRARAFVEHAPPARIVRQREFIQHDVAAADVEIVREVSRALRRPGAINAAGRFLFGPRREVVRERQVIRQAAPAPVQVRGRNFNVEIR